MIGENQSGYVFANGNSTYDDVRPKVIASFLGSRVEMLIDSGTNDNVISALEYCNMLTRPVLKKSQVNLYSYNSQTPLNIKGEFTCDIEVLGKKCSATIKVVDGKACNLLSFETSRRLGLFQTKQFCGINAVKTMESSYDWLFERYPMVFNDNIGRLRPFVQKTSLYK